MPRPEPATGTRVALAIDDAATAEAAQRALRARGIAPERGSIEEAIAGDADALGVAPCEPLAPAEAAKLAPACERAARAGRPIALLEAISPAGGDRGVEERAASAAYLRAHGAVVVGDPDAWLEVLVLIACFGVPPGPRASVVASPSGWLWASAAALAAEAEQSGARPAAVAGELARLGPTDVVLADAALARADAPRRRFVLPVVGRAEFLTPGEAPALVGLRSALAAASAAGAAGERAAAGLGPDAPDGASALEPDLERFHRQLGKLGERAGDHEAKVLLAAYGVPVTRQAVATTASAAARVAKKAGFPVDVVPWGPDWPTEPDGCPVERDLHTAAEVRRAFVAAGSALGADPEAPVIVRAAPPAGRDLRVRIERIRGLDWIVIAEIPGAPEKLAAPAPLRVCDAERIARHVEASRAGEPEPDREGLADLLRRASHMVVAHGDALSSLDLARVIAAAGEPPLVADARVELAR